MQLLLCASVSRLYRFDVGRLPKPHHDQGKRGGGVGSSVEQAVAKIQRGSSRRRPIRRFGRDRSATDPYQPIEGKAYITRKCLKVLARYRIPVTITTRSPLILRDIDLLSEMNVDAVNISIHSLDPDITRKLEPATSFPMKRMETIQKLSESGIRAGVFLAPIVPFITDDMEELDTLLHTAKRHNAAFAMPSLLRLSPDVKYWFFQTLKQHFPHLVAKYTKLYTSTYADRSYADPLMASVRSLVGKYDLTQKFVREEAKEDHPSQAPSEHHRIPEQLTFLF